MGSFANISQAGNTNNLSMGNGVLFINDVDCGYLKGDVNFKYNYSLEDFKTGNPQLLVERMAKELTSELTAPIAELSAANFAMALGGLTVHDVAAAEVNKTVNWETLTFADNINVAGLQTIKLGATANRDKAVTITAASVVVELADSTPCTEDTDYFVSYDTGLVYRNPASAVITSAATVKVKYKYTPAASSRLDLGYQFTLAKIKVKFVHVHPNTGKAITITLWQANANGSVDLKFAETGFIVNNVTFQALYDATHADNPMGTIEIEE